MTEKKKTEVNLEMCSGFFRIPTDDIVYNITVLASNEPSTTKIVEKIIEVEKIVEVERKTPASVVPAAPVVSMAEPAPDEYFKEAATKFQQEIALAAKEAGAAPTAGAGPDLNAIHDLAAMSTDLKDVLLALKKQALSSVPASGGGGANLTPALAELLDKIAQAQGMCGQVPVAAAVSKAAPSTKTSTRYLFNLDTVFQTIYELCTNETVKTHIKNARARIDEIFDTNIFLDAISPKVSGYPEDDGFMNVPMSDIYGALGAACNDKGICNLLIKMDKQQADIFLDQFLLMEVPAREEVTVADGGGASAVEDILSPATGGDSRLLSLLNDCQASLDVLIAQSAEQGGGTSADGSEFGDSIDDAINIAASIQHDAKRLAAETGGGAVDPLWLKIKGLAALTEAMLKSKAADPALSFADGLAGGQAAAQRCLAEITPKPPAAASQPAPKKEVAPPKAPAAAENFGEASQDDIDRLLEELG